MQKRNTKVSEDHFFMYNNQLFQVHNSQSRKRKSCFITPEILLSLKEQTQSEAAKKLGISKATLKRRKKEFQQQILAEKKKKMEKMQISFIIKQTNQSTMILDEQTLHELQLAFSAIKRPLH